MKIQLWHCKEMNLWRWTVVKDDRPICKQESGQDSDLDLAMKNILRVIEDLKNQK